jgi:hypothetical protein
LTCIFPYSAQRTSVGITLPGLSRPAGSKARLTAAICSRSAAENCTHIDDSFSTPTPCSPVTVPPIATLSSRISAPKASARCSWSLSLASNRISGCRLPSPAVEDVGAAQAMALVHLGDGDQHVGEALPRNRRVHAHVVGADPAARRERVLAPAPELQPLGLAAARRQAGRSPGSRALDHARDLVLDFCRGAVASQSRIAAASRS